MRLQKNTTNVAGRGRGCVYSFIRSGNNEKCPYCKAERINKTDEGKIEELMKRVEANDAS